MEFRRKTLFFPILLTAACAYIITENPEQAHQHAINLPAISEVSGKRPTLGNSESYEIPGELGSPVNAKDEGHSGHRIRRLAKREVDDVDVAGRVAKAIIDYYDSQERRMTDVYGFEVKMFDDVDVLINLQATLRHPKHPTAKLVDILRQLNIELPEDQLPVQIDSIKLHAALQGAVDHVNRLDKWYTFLIIMHDRLSMYNVQKDRDTLKAEEMSRMCAKKKLVSHAALREFVEKVDLAETRAPQKLLAEYKTVRNVPIDVAKSDGICKSLEVSLESPVTTSCLGNGVMQVRGDIVKLSDVSDDCPGDLKVLQIFALNKVYLDKDLDERNKKLQIAVIAPSWEIVGEKTCEAAMSFYNWTREFRSWLCQPQEGNKESLFWFMRCDNPMLPFCSKKPGDDPTDTIPVFKTLCNLDGVVRPGIDPAVCPTTFVTKNANGRLAFLYEFIQKRCLPATKLFCQLKDRHFKMDPLAALLPKYISESPVERLIDLSADRIDKHPVRRINKPNEATGVIEKDGLPGEPGKPGGNFFGIGRQFVDLDKLMIITDGGQGGVGFGGRAGKKSYVASERRGGDGGQGGRGGRAGTAMILELSKYYRSPKYNVRSMNGADGFHGFGGWPGGLNVVQHPYQPSGFFGRTGANSQGAKQPEASMIYQGLPSIVNDYKLYITYNMNNKWKKYVLKEMYEDMNNDTTISSGYNTLDFVNELIDLETIYLAKNGQGDFLPLYENFQSRVNEYIEQHGEDWLSREQKKVSLYLRAAALSKICVLKDGSKDNLVIHIRKLLDTVMSDISLLQETQADAAIKKYNEDYQKEVDLKINEADNFIAQIILPEVENINQQIEKQIQDLIKEAKDKQDQIAANSKALQLTMGLKKGFTVLTHVLAILPFFPNVAAEFSNGLNIINVIGPSLVPAIEENKVPSGVEKLLGDIKPHFQRFANMKKQVLQELLKTIDWDKTGLLKDVRQRIYDITNKMKILSDNKELSIVKAIVDNKAKELIKLEPNPANKIALKVLTHVQDDLKVAEQSVSTYLKNKNSTENMKQLITSIRLVGEDKNVKSLKDFEDNIFLTLLPMLKNMRADVSSIVNNLNGESLAALDVIKWRTMNSIKDVSRKLQQYTTEFKVKEPLAVWMDKLDEAISTVIKIYERKQNYLEHLRLADYIAQIHSAGMNGIGSQDKNLARALANLRLIVQSNVVLGQHRRAISAFKQFMFPFATIDLSKFDSKPSNMSIDIAGRVQHAVRQLNDLKAQIDKSDFLVEDHKESIWKGDFDRRTRRSNGPFFTWNNESHSETLSKLLSGEKVILRADLSKGFDANAVKFRKIGIRFVPADKAIPQAELNEALEIFDAHMMHMGNSYYRCDDKCYVMTSKGVTVKYSFQLNDAGKPVDSNEAYELIGEGDFMLSPYALWTFQLATRNKKDFADLVKYKNRVNLELQGYGKYVETGNNICKTNNLDLYYQQTACT